MVFTNLIILGHFEYASLAIWITKNKQGISFGSAILFGRAGNGTRADIISWMNEWTAVHRSEGAVVVEVERWAPIPFPERHDEIT